jgi:hypothetical protein
VGRDPVQTVCLGIDHANKYMKGPIQKVEFLAKRLIFETASAPREPSFLLGTPLYVALVD